MFFSSTCSGTQVSVVIEAREASPLQFLFTTTMKITNIESYSVETAGSGTKTARLRTHVIPKQDRSLCVNGPPKTVFFRGKTQLRPTVTRLMCPSTLVHHLKTIQVS